MSNAVAATHQKFMRKLANHVTLFWSHDDTGYLVKYSSSVVLGLAQY